MNVPKTGGLLSDVIVSSPIVAGEDGSAPMGMSAGDFEFGVDPNLDPELALVNLFLLIDPFEAFLTL